MNFIVIKFLRVVRFAFLIAVANGDDAQHPKFIGYTQQFFYICFGTYSFFFLATPHLHPAASKSQIMSFQLHNDGSYGCIFHPHIGSGLVGNHNYAQG